jgi:hypothetical protein
VLTDRNPCVATLLSPLRGSLARSTPRIFLRRFADFVNLPLHFLVASKIAAQTPMGRQLFLQAYTALKRRLRQVSRREHHSGMLPRMQLQIQFHVQRSGYGIGTIRFNFLESQAPVHGYGIWHHWLDRVETHFRVSNRSRLGHYRFGLQAS